MKNSNNERALKAFALWPRWKQEFTLTKYSPDLVEQKIKTAEKTKKKMLESGEISLFRKRNEL